MINQYHPEDDQRAESDSIEAADEIKRQAANCGPVYNVPLIDTLPFNTDGPAIGMLQQMPNREDLEQVRKRNERVVAGYEVLLNHYTEQKATIEALRRRVAELEEHKQCWEQAASEYADVLKALTAENAELKVERDAYKMRGDGHWATLKAIREFAREGDCERIILWVGDAASGYVETTEETIAKVIAENADLKRQVEALREDAEIGRLVKQLVEQTGEGSGVVELWKDMGVYCYSNDSARVVAQFPSLVETLREAAKKGEVEG